MTLTEMRSLLAKRDIQLTRSLGQNFLHDGNQLRRIVDAAEITPTDKILEIGPGLGPLTELLLEKAGEVLAIEMDARLVNFLCDRFGTEQRNPDLLTEALAGQPEEPAEPEPGAAFHLLHDDALAFLKREPRDWSDWKFVANLPYSVASPILVELAAGVRAPKMIVATLQFEVARRLMAQADDDDYGILTLLVQIDFEPRSSFKIPPES
jgi:16S rRNA (adenine1518-N6/adenine1519-N6)-dimethyltransferase